MTPRRSSEEGGFGLVACMWIYDFFCAHPSLTSGVWSIVEWHSHQLHRWRTPPCPWLALRAAHSEGDSASIGSMSTTWVRLPPHHFRGTVVHPVHPRSLASVSEMPPAACSLGVLCVCLPARGLCTEHITNSLFWPCLCSLF